MRPGQLVHGASYWGHQIDISSMRRRFSVSLKGVTLKGLMAMAQGLALHTRPLKLDMQHLPELKLPAILHWDLNHFVVLKSVSGSHAVIHDPAVGERRLPLAEVAKHFTGVALELTPTAEFKKVEEKQQFSLLSLMGRVVGLKRGLLQLLVLGLALQVCALVAPFYMQWLVDEALLAADRDLITVLGCGFLLLVLIQTAIGAVRSWITTVLATNLNLQWLGNAFAHLLKLPLPYFEKRHTGDIVSRFNSIQTMQRSLTTQFVEGAIDGVLVLATLGMMLIYSPLLAGVACIAVVLYVLLRWAIFKALREATAEQIIHAAKQQTHFLESVRGIQSIRLFGRNEERRASWMNALADQFNADLRIARLSVSYQTANTFLFSAERVIIIWMAALAVLDNRFSVGMLFAFISYKDQFSQRMASLVDKLFELRMLRLHGERVADIVLTKAEEDSNDVEIDVEHISPSIEVRNLAFRYADSEPYVLERIEPDDTGRPVHCGDRPVRLRQDDSDETAAGLAGADRRRDPDRRRDAGEPGHEELPATAGHRNAGRQPVRRLDRRQHQLLCAVAEPAASAGLRAAGGRARRDRRHADGFQYPGGRYRQRPVGRPKQRILLARALYCNPKLLVLDEATSHLDVWNEQAVNAAIQKIQLTRVIVAHRPETIAMASGW